MTIIVLPKPCWDQPHAPHVFPIVHPNAPTFVHNISCPGKPVKREKK